jgi:glycine hydroxymethyltransferase
MPDDTLPPLKPSGIRLGTPAMTSRGAKEEDMVKVAKWMKEAIDARDDSVRLAELREEVRKWARKFPLLSDRA